MSSKRNLENKESRLSELERQPSKMVILEPKVLRTSRSRLSELERQPSKMVILEPKVLRTSRSRLSELEESPRPKKKRSTAKKIATFAIQSIAYSLNPKDVSLFSDKKKSDVDNGSTPLEELPDISLIKPPTKFKRQIRESRWMQGHFILDQEKKDGKKHLLVETHYVWDTKIKIPNQSLLSIWVFAIISVYDKETNTFKRKNVTVNIGKEFSEKYYNHIGFRTVGDKSEVFDENDLINYIVQNSDIWY
jgi:hypothetical protein